MARPKKAGKRATGVQSKKGFLYIVRSQPVIKDGKRVIEKKWIATGLPDTPENVKMASEARMKMIVNNQSVAVDKNITISEYIDTYLERKKREISDTTYASYLYRSKRIKKFFGDTKMKDLNEILVESFLDDFIVKYQMQPRTVKDTKVFFGSVIEQAVKEGIIPRNPVKEVVVNKSLMSKYTKEKNMDDEFFSYEEAALFLSKVEDHELYELFYMTLFFGLRREEVLGLRWKCIDFGEKLMKINHTVTRGTMVNRINTAKTAASIREYPLTDEQIGMLKRLKIKEDNNRELFGDCYSDNDYIFKHEDGTLYYPDYPSKAFAKLIKRMPELPQGITFHGLRSSCVSILVHENMDIKSIQKWVGHADMDTTLRIYAKVKDKAAKKEISESMSNIIRPKKYKDEYIDN